MKMYFQCVRKPGGRFSEWALIAGLPDELPEGSTVGIYPRSGNRIHTVPGDTVRYYELIDGAVCHHCGSLIDKSIDIHAETRADREKNLCKKCWSAIGHGELDLPQTICDVPLYRLKNSILDNPLYF